MKPSQMKTLEIDKKETKLSIGEFAGKYFIKIEDGPIVSSIILEWTDVCKLQDHIFNYTVDWVFEKEMPEIKIKTLLNHLVDEHEKGNFGSKIGGEND